MDILLIIILGIVGVGLLLLEFFLLPGFGIAGICGFGSLAAAVVMAYILIGPQAGMLTLVASGVLSIVAIVAFFRGHGVDRMALDAKIDSKVELPKHGKRMEKMEEAEDKEQA